MPDRSAAIVASWLLPGRAQGSRSRRRSQLSRGADPGAGRGNQARPYQPQPPRFPLRPSRRRRSRMAVGDPDGPIAQHGPRCPALTDGSSSESCPFGDRSARDSGRAVSGPRRRPGRSERVWLLDQLRPPGRSRRRSARPWVNAPPSRRVHTARSSALIDRARRPTRATPSRRGSSSQTRHSQPSCKEPEAPPASAAIAIGALDRSITAVTFSVARLTLLEVRVQALVTQAAPPVRAITPRPWPVGASRGGWRVELMSNSLTQPMAGRGGVRYHLAARPRRDRVRWRGSQIRDGRGGFGDTRSSGRLRSPHLGAEPAVVATVALARCCVNVLRACLISEGDRTRRARHPGRLSTLVNRRNRLRLRW